MPRGRPARRLYLRAEDSPGVARERESKFARVPIAPKNDSKNNCVKLMILWIKLSTFAVDIALFDILHKHVVKALIKRQGYGMRCRVVIYRHLMHGEKMNKHRKYLSWLQSAGVQIRWASLNLTPVAAVAPCLFHRFILIDCADSYDMQGQFEACVIHGDQFSYVPSISIVNDMYGLHIVKQPPNDINPWRMKFHQLWTAPDATSDHTGTDTDFHPAFAH